MLKSGESDLTVVERGDAQVVLDDAGVEKGAPVVKGEIVVIAS